MSTLSDMAQSMRELERGRAAFEAQAWSDARTALSAADLAQPLGAPDLELLATAAYMIGREDEYLNVQERCHHALLEAGETLPAARCAFWVGMHLAIQGEAGRASGWLGRSQRLVEREQQDCVERGYLLMPTSVQEEMTGDYEASAATAAESAVIGERFGDQDLFALAVHQQGCVLIKDGRVADGLALLDEAMVAVTAGEVSPIVSGIVYCGVILGCQDAYELRRAQEWTAALTRWCEQQPDMVAFTGRCMLHRAEIMQLHGAWADAVEEARRAAERSAQSQNTTASAEAVYRQAEVLRLRGEFDDAESAYREASRQGREPQPGLSLLRLAQGDKDAAVAAIRRVAGETTERFKRAALLPAYVEIMLAAGDLGAARSACAELEEISTELQSGMLEALAGQAQGAVALADGDAMAALVALRRAAGVWQQLRAPYEAARARTLVGQACRAQGDEDAAALELDAARDAFDKLGAAPDIARVDALVASDAAPADTHGLTARELDVVRLIAAGETNKAIASELVLSERTVDRHVSNIFAKLGVSTRAAATAYAYEHQLV